MKKPQYYRVTEMQVDRIRKLLKAFKPDNKKYPWPKAKNVYLLKGVRYSTPFDPIDNEKREMKRFKRKFRKVLKQK